MAALRTESVSAYDKRLKRLAQEGHFEECLAHLKKHDDDGIFCILKGACRGGHYNFVRHLFDERKGWYFGSTLRDAARSGNEELVTLILDHHICGTELSMGLKGACRRGHRNIVDLLIKRGANDWDQGLYGACRGGQLDLAYLMLRKGAKDVNLGMNGACSGGHEGLGLLMIHHGADQWDRGFNCACAHGHLKLAEWMVARGAGNYGKGLSSACGGGHWAVMDYILAEFNLTDRELGFAMEHAYVCDQPEIVQYLAQKGAFSKVLAEKGILSVSVQLDT